MNDLFDTGSAESTTSAGRSVAVVTTTRGRKGVRKKRVVERVKPWQIPTGADRVRKKGRWKVYGSALWKEHADSHIEKVVGEMETYVDAQGVERECMIPAYEKKVYEGQKRIKLPLWLFPSEWVSCPVCSKDLSGIFYESKADALKQVNRRTRVEVVLIEG